MIRYDLLCQADHAFEAWFSNSAEYDRQAETGLLECPICGDAHVRKAIVAPNVARTDREPSGPTPEQRQQFFAAMRKHVEDNFEDVGDKFADTARAIHDGVEEERPIYGEATPEEAKDLLEDGIAVAPLPPPITPRKKRKRLN